jgi:hypothetical protein
MAFLVFLPTPTPASIISTYLPMPANRLGYLGIVPLCLSQGQQRAPKHFCLPHSASALLLLLHR